jgi:uncharacterized protein
MANMMEFKEVKIGDKEIFDKYFKEYPPVISEFTFTNIFCWRLSKKHEFSVIDGHMIISFNDEGNRKFYQPVGENPPEAIKRVIEMFPDARFERVEKSVAERLGSGFIVSRDRGMDDYVYKTSDLIELPGARYQPKRNFVKRFESYNPVTCTLNEKTAKGFCELHEEWCNLRNCRDDKNADEEYLAVREALKNFRALGIFGFCVHVKGKVAGFAVGEPLNDETYVEHFEKANTEFTGAYQYLLNGFAKSIPKQFVFLNREQDLGVEGLRKSKLSYHPVKMTEKYEVKGK